MSGGLWDLIGAPRRQPSGARTLGDMASAYLGAPEDEATPVGLAPGQMPVDPRRDGMVQPNTLGRAMQHAVGTKAGQMAQALLDVASLPGDVNAGRTDPLSDDGIRRAFDLAGTLATGGMPMAEAGAAGIFGGRLSRTANKEALAEAQEQAAMGIGRRDIWNETGWFQGADNKWRYEIPDNLTRFSGHGPIIGNALDHPEVYRSYPGSIYTKFERKPIGKDYYGWYGGSPENNPSIVVNKSLNKEMSHNTTLHELQHDIQARENFLNGGDPSQFSAEQWKDYILKRANSGAPVSRDDLTKEAFANWQHEQYARMPGEVEARNVERRRIWSDAERRSVPPWESADVSWPQPSPSDTQIPLSSQTLDTLADAYRGRR